jgi:hypothetical protein
MCEQQLGGAGAKSAFQKILLNVNLVFGINFNTITMLMQKRKRAGGEQKNFFEHAEPKLFHSSNATFNLIFDSKNPIERERVKE